MKAYFSRLAYVVVFLLVATYAVVTLRGPNGVHAVTEKQVQIREMEKRNAALAKEIEQRQEHIKRLTDNPAEQELEIRDRLKLIRPNEKVFITGEPDKK